MQYYELRSILDRFDEIIKLLKSMEKEMSRPSLFKRVLNKIKSGCLYYRKQEDKL